MCAGLGDVSAVFVLDAEDGPDPAADNFGDGDAEVHFGEGLDLFLVDGVEDPIEAEDEVEGHGEVVAPWVREGEDVAEEGVFGSGVAEGPVVEDVPECWEKGVKGGVM